MNHKIIPFLSVLFLLTNCKSPKEKIEDTILYQDSMGYWNYEWPRDRAEYYGFTFKFMKKNKLQKLSFNKVEKGEQSGMIILMMNQFTDGGGR